MSKLWAVIAPRVLPPESLDCLSVAIGICRPQTALRARTSQPKAGYFFRVKVNVPTSDFP
jgi:hypothetical protein